MKAQQNTSLVIKQGATLNGPASTAGIVITVLAIILSVWIFHSWVWLLLLIPGIYLMLAFAGSTINKNNSTLFSWISFFGIRLGKTRSIAGYTQVHLIQYSAAQQISMRSACQNSRTRTFELWLYGPQLKRKHIADIPSLNDARHYLHRIAEILQIEAIDRYQEMLERNASRRVTNQQRQ